MSDTRLIERWLPIGAIGEESARERRSMTALPPTYYLHVWWARRPLVASRAAVLASLLPADADQGMFLRAIGIHGDPVAVRARIERARKTGEDLGVNPYGYARAFTYVPTRDELNWIQTAFAQIGSADIVTLDPTAGGGSIPFECIRLGLTTMSNDLNPVAALIERATVEFPLLHSAHLSREFQHLAARFIARSEPRFQDVFPLEPNGAQVLGYLWARTVTCPYCSGRVPLSPNWRLTSVGTGLRLNPILGTGPNDPSRKIEFEVVKAAAQQSAATVGDGDGICPFPDCRRQIDGDEIKRQAQLGLMGEQLTAVAFKRRIETRTKSGKRGSDKWQRGYRAPRPEDDNSELIARKLAEKLPEWEALDIIPTEKIGDPSNYDRGHRMYGMYRWVDMYSPRQLLCHGTAVEVFRELLSDEQVKGDVAEATKAAFVYLALALDKLRDYNSRATRWIVQREVIANTFDSHNFAMKWSYVEMAPQVVGLGYEWAIEQIAKCIRELVALVCPEDNDNTPQGDLLRTNERENERRERPLSVTVTCKSGDSLDHIEDASVDCVVMDPPYYDNVMYAELSDFFYVWLKRTAGYVYPELFRRQLTDKESEAVANSARFKGEKGAKTLAGRAYQSRMAAIFSEMRRVLKPNGIMTLMFTHKATGAWDALTKGLMEAGFTITASWPINTEAEGSLHIKDKAAANSTIFLVCRPHSKTHEAREPVYWEDVEPLVARAVRLNVQRFRESGIGGVDLYLASFGPALEEFSKHWPLKRGTPRAKPEELKRRRQAEMFEEEFDPYAVTPEDALNAARREVKRWKLEQLTHMKANAELDPGTSWFVLAWDAFRSTVFDYDEALRLARAVGVDLDNEIVGWLAEKKGSDVRLWDSSERAAKGVLGPADGSRAMIDVIHHAAHLARTRNLDASRELLAGSQVDRDPKFFASLEAVLEVLPVSKAFSGIELEGDAAAQGSDFEVLENLRRLAFSEHVDEPNQLELWRQETAA
jgi:putative DNA methylase